MRHARYRGRHRQSSNAARLTAVGAIGVGTLAATVIAPAAAHADAANSQWDRVAQCESGGNWHIDTGNGYYGGLQFSSSTWNSFDTNNFAGRADEASRGQQITVANRVLARQGWGAWPVCSQYRGEPTAEHTHHTHKSKSAHRSEHKAGHLIKKGDWVLYRVRSGDTLAGIASRHHVKGGWHALFRRNRDVIGANPSMIHAGDKLRLHKKA
jgi:hypothetical protein